MDVHSIWKAVLILTVGIMLIRLSGRRSISQMTISETVIMISIGTLLIQPIANKNIWFTFGLALILILTLIVVQYIQLKWDAAESFFTGRSKIVIENGKLNETSMRKLRLTVDKLEMRLRQNGIEKISDVQWGTIEPSGQFGYSLIEKKKFATKEDIDKIQTTLDNLFLQLNQHNYINPVEEKDTLTSNVFSEIKSGHIPPEKDYLK